MQECPPLGKSPDQVNMGDLLQITADVAAKYHECRKRHSALIQWAK